MPWSQQKGEEEPDINPSVPQQDVKLDHTEGEVIADCDLDGDYEGLESKNESVTQREREKS